MLRNVYPGRETGPEAASSRKRFRSGPVEKHREKMRQRGEKTAVYSCDFYPVCAGAHFRIIPRIPGRTGLKKVSISGSYRKKWEKVDNRARLKKKAYFRYFPNEKRA